MTRASDRVPMSVSLPVTRVNGDTNSRIVDQLAIEEPLEIRVDAVDGGSRRTKSLSITMRTPGHDGELAAGFLFTEGILRTPSDIAEIVVVPSSGGAHKPANTIEVRLHDHAVIAWPKLDRHFYSTSSCGVCGKASLDALEVPGMRPVSRGGFQVAASAIHTLQAKVRAHQATFELTGGLHGAALFNGAGELLSLREDVGRHNAVDKLLGREFIAGATPLSDRLLFLSGRASFELIQKALVAGVAGVVAVGAPSSLAVELAKRFDITLIGFVREDRFNIYHGEWRVVVR